MQNPQIPSDDGYNLQTAAKVCGLSTHMLNYLCRHKIVEPTGGKKRGRGNRRLYSFADLLLLRVMEKLLAKGVSALRLRDAIRGVQDRGRSKNELISNKYIVTDGVDIYFEDDGMLERLASGQLTFAFVLQLDTLRQETSDVIRSTETAA